MPPRRRTPFIFRILDRLTHASYGALFLLWLEVVLCFAVLYTLLGYAPSNHGLAGTAATSALGRLVESLYFSVITSTTVGYGDLTPVGFSRVLAAIQSVTGFGIFALFVAKLVSFKTDLATREVHTMMFESKFHHTREGLFTIRKDFDAIIIEAKESKRLPDDTLERLRVACWSGRTLLEEITEFYDKEHRLYVLDTQREKLLLEAVDRTLQRLLGALAAVKNNRVPDDIGRELRSFAGFLTNIMTTWQRLSPHRSNKAWFMRMRNTGKMIGSRLQI